MEQIKHNHFGRANFEARTVKDITESAESIFNKASVKAALDEMQARAVNSSHVIDQRGELLGAVSQNKMNREVGGFGHDPKTEPIEAHIDRNNPYCFEDQTVAAAEQIMLNAKVGEVFVVTREKFLVGTINIEAIAQENRRRNAWKPLKSRAWERHNRVFDTGYSTTSNQRIPQKLNDAVTEGLTCTALGQIHRILRRFF